MDEILYSVFPIPIVASLTIPNQSKEHIPQKPTFNILLENFANYQYSQPLDTVWDHVNWEFEPKKKK